MRDILYNFFLFLKSLALVLLSFFIFASLFTYNSNNPSFNTVTTVSSNTMVISNIASYTADLLLQIFGMSSFLIGVLFFLYGVRAFLKPRNKISFINYVICAVIMLFCLSGLLTYFSLPITQKYFGGGIVGRIVYSIPVYLLSILLICSSIGLLGWRFFLNPFIKLFASLKAIFTVKAKVLVEKDDIPITIEEPLDITKKEPILKKIKKHTILQQYVPIKSTKSDVLLKSSFNLPKISLLTKPKEIKKKYHDVDNTETLTLLAEVLKDFGIQGSIINVRYGPVVTLYELEPSAGTKSSRVIGLADDIARSMSALSARIAVVPGKNVIGIELPNQNREIVMLRDILESSTYCDANLRLPIALGKGINGEPIVADLAKMPHLLVAGTTGSGKSVAINTMILSLVYSLNPDQCKMIMIDPKMLELSVYDDIPHLLTPVVTEPKKAIAALRWVVKEMENRYRAMSNLGVRNILGYNEKVDEAISRGKNLEKNVQTGFDKHTGAPLFEKISIKAEKFPYIVVIVDEMADLMLVAGKDIESSIQRLAQMARAAGIHIIMATQRPSVDVITGVIKANFPTRISFAVTSKIDSRTILGEQGAEQLLGMGDMLYMVSGGKIIRVHGPFVSDDEVQSVVNYLKSQGAPSYVDGITKEDEENSVGGDLTNKDDNSNEDNVLYNRALEIVLKERKASTSYIQRQLRIGYNRAANIIERMERESILSAPNHSGKREILVN